MRIAKNKILRNIFLLGFLLASIYANAQPKGYLEVRCRVLKDRRPIDGAEVKIYKNAGLVNKLVSENGGKFTLNLDFNNNYLITVAYPNCYNKSVEFATQVADKDNELVFKYPFSIDLVEMVPGTSNSDEFTKPIAKVVYNAINGAFEINEQYTKIAQADFNKKIEQAQKAAEQKNQTPQPTSTFANTGATPNPAKSPAPPAVNPATTKPKTDSINNNKPIASVDPKAAEEARNKAAAEEKARKQAELKASIEADALARKAILEKAKHEAEEKERLAEQEKARKKAEAELQARERKIAQEKAESEAAEKARKDAEEQARRKAAEDAYQARLKAEKEVAEQARRDSELKAQQEEAMRRQLSIDEQNRIAAVAKAQKESELKAQHDAEERARREAAEKLKAASEKKVAEDNIIKKALSGKAGKITEETINEKNRTIQKTTITQANGIDLIYQIISYNWGGIFYFKNQLSISKDVYDNEITNIKENLKSNKQ